MYPRDCFVKCWLFFFISHCNPAWQRENNRILWNKISKTCWVRLFEQQTCRPRKHKQIDKCIQNSNGFCRFLCGLLVLFVRSNLFNTFVVFTFPPFLLLGCWHFLKQNSEVPESVGRSAEKLRVAEITWSTWPLERCERNAMNSWSVKAQRRCPGSKKPRQSESVDIFFEKKSKVFFCFSGRKANKTV